ncbi:MAG: rimL [Clostridia bacterium]|jgi:RimJ/RimL family protein N-acetyltransferase|nr:rimL [Clostridia bacterium]
MIEGKLINLRIVKQSDLEELIPLLSDTRERGEFLNPNMVNEVMYRKRYQETGFWNEEFGSLLITNKSGRLLGDIAFFKGVNYLPGFEIGYNIFRSEDRGKGYTTEALRLFSAYLFETKTIHRLEVHADMNNTGSRKVAEKCGFTYEGMKRQAVYARGSYSDLAIYSMLKHECPSFTEMIQK